MARRRKAKTGWGGYREGAGRKPKYGDEPAAKRCLSLSQEVADRLDELAAAEGRPLSNIVNDLLRQALRYKRVKGK